MIRRGVFSGGLMLAAAGALWRTPAGAKTPGFDFEVLGRGVNGQDHISLSYDSRALMLWGDFAPRRQA